MIKSMTGFGRCEISDANRKFTVEIKSVNHRYFDINIRMPRKLNFFEASIRNLLKKYAQRGKIDIFISYEDMTENQVVLKYNENLAAEYMNYFKQMEDRFGLENDIRVSSLARYPELLVMEEQVLDEEELWNCLKRALEGAFIQFVETRITEGENLRLDISAKLEEMLASVAYIDECSPKIVAEYQAKLMDKIKEVLESTQLEESRVAAEVVIFADKICTDEEIIRLRSHIENMRATLESGEGIGRKLDFIAQEMNREANTILSKANNLEVSNQAIDLKTHIEKVREQIQNIE